MRLSKAQLAVITILNVVIAALVAAVFLLPYLRGKTEGGEASPPPTDGDTTVTVPPDVHNKLREASAGRVPEIAYETRLMGTGDETVVGAYFTDEYLYVFGNATVGDYDFDDYGGFLCKLDSSGKIVAFMYFDGRMTAVGIVEGGYAVATLSGAGTPEERARLYFVEYAAAEPKEVATPHGEVCDIMSVSPTRIAVVTRGGANSVRLTEYALGGDTWATERSTDISSGYALEFLDCFALGEQYIIAARASSLPRYDSVVFFTFKVGGDPSSYFYGGTGDSMLQPYAVMPYERGYVMLCRRNGVASIVSVDYSFKSYRRDMLGFAFDTARLLYADNKYYACFEESGSVRAYELDSDMQTRRTLTAVGGSMPDAAATGERTLLLAKTSLTATIVAPDGDPKIVLGMSDAKIYSGHCKNNTLTVVLSATGGDALSKPSGGRDVYIITLRL